MGTCVKKGTLSIQRQPFRVSLSLTETQEARFECLFGGGKRLDSAGTARKAGEKLGLASRESWGEAPNKKAVVTSTRRKPTLQRQAAAAAAQPEKEEADASPTLYTSLFALKLGCLVIDGGNSQTEPFA